MRPYHHFISLSLNLAIAASFSAACTPKKAELSSTRIVNGSVINDREYPEVEYIRRGSFACTGTFVSSEVMITAAHCVLNDAGQIESIVLTRNLARSVKILVNPNYDHNKKGSYVSDVAVVLFPRNSAKANTTFNPVRIKVGDEFTIVGFGRPQEDSGMSGVKRVGTNRLTHQSDSYIYFESPAFADGSDDNAGAAPGDSGGPLFVDHKITGVTSSGWVDSLNHNLYVNLQTAANMQFLRDAANQGIVVPGVPDTLIGEPTSEGLSGDESKDPLPKLFVALSPKADTAGGYRAFVASTSNNLASVRYCLGSTQTCSKVGQTWFKANNDTKGAKNITLFRTSGGITPSQGLRVTFAGTFSDRPETVWKTVTLNAK